MKVTDFKIKSIDASNNYPKSKSCRVIAVIEFKSEEPLSVYQLIGLPTSNFDFIVVTTIQNQDGTFTHTAKNPKGIAQLFSISDKVDFILEGAKTRPDSQPEQQ